MPGIHGGEQSAAQFHGPHGERHRGQQGRHRDAHRGAPRPEGAEVDLVARHEQEQDHGDLGQHRQERPRLGGEQTRGQVPGKPAQQGRSQGDPGEDLADHRRLPEPPGQAPEHPGDQDDEGHVTENGG
ncbi:hypothetical protein O1M54_03545 [Streptomyces diastatochromogenes]|nr:hypothetical protein [Streptomyces diastatochromogenes]